VKGPKKLLKIFFEKKYFLRGYVAGEREFENGGLEPRGPLERAQKIYEFFLKCRRCVLEILTW